MSNTEERLDEIERHFIAAWLQTQHKTVQVPAYGLAWQEAKQAITSLIKELVAAAKIDELKHLVYDDGIWYEDMTRQFPQKITFNQRIKELEALSYNNHTLPEVIAPTTADRKRAELEARIDELERTMPHTDGMRHYNTVKRRIAELKAQQEEL